MGRLFWKLVFAFWLALAAAAAVISATVWLERRANEGTDPELAVGPPHMIVTNMAASTLDHGGVEALRAWMKELDAVRPLPLYAVDAQGRDLLGRPVPEAAWRHAQALATAEPNSNAARVAGFSEGSLLLFVPRAETLPRPMPRFLPWLAILVGVLTSVALSVLIAWYLTRSINTLRAALDAAAAGKLDTRVTPVMGARNDEIADLGRHFNRMAEQLQAHVSAQRRLLHDMSHEVRSPLARLNAAAGLLRQDPRKQAISLDRIEREVARLNEMMEEILTLSRLETGAMALRPETLDLAAMVAAIVSDARFEGEAAGKSVAMHGTVPLAVHAQESMLYPAIENIVRNAVKYTGAGSTVEVDLGTGGHPLMARLTVADRGPGIPNDDLHRIFEPFYRSGDTGSTKGFGLGLAIAHRAISMNRGSVRAQNRAGGGLQVEISLPLAA